LKKRELEVLLDGLGVAWGLVVKGFGELVGEGRVEFCLV
jgi:hypothetical protein